MNLDVGGRRIFFDVEGAKFHNDGTLLTEKPTLILLHGSPGNSDHTVFKPMFSALCDIAQIVYVDLAGSGRSDDPLDGVFSLESWADDVVRLCEGLGIQSPIVLGNSAGGMVAAMYGIRHPGHASKLILSSTQAKLTADRCLDMFERLGGPEVRLIAERALVTVGDLESYMAYASRCMPLYNTTPQQRVRHSALRFPCADAFHRVGGIWHRMDFLHELIKITSPTMIMVGDQDPVTPVEDSEDMCSVVRPSLLRYERFSNAGHSVWLDEPVKAFAVLREFITAEGGA